MNTFRDALKFFWVIALIVVVLIVSTLVGCGTVPNYTITCDGPNYGQVAIMINDNNCPPDYRKRP